MDELLTELAARYNAYITRRTEIQEALSEVCGALQQRINRRVELQLIDEDNLVWQIQTLGSTLSISSDTVDEFQRDVDSFGNRMPERSKSAKEAIMKIMQNKLRYTT